MSALRRAAILGVVLAAVPARADQCQWVTLDEATKAFAVLAPHPRVVAWCEPCGERAFGLPVVARSVEMRRQDEPYWEIAINGEAVDLAYTFVRAWPGRYENLGLLVGCDASGVSRSVSIIEPVEEEEAPPEAASPEPAPTVARARRFAWWRSVALAIGALAIGVALALRRRGRNR